MNLTDQTAMRSCYKPGKNVFMLGAFGIMRANGGYVMRTAFRRVPHAYCWVVFK